MKKRISVAMIGSLICLSMTINAFAVDYTNADVVQRIQEALNEEGYDCGTPDGKAGTKTNEAVSQFREANGLPAGEELNDELAIALGLIDPEDTHDVKYETTTDEVKTSMINLQDSLFSYLQPVMTEIGVQSGTVTDYGNAQSINSAIYIDAKIETDTGKTLLATCAHIPNDIVDWEIMYVQDMSDGHYYYVFGEDGTHLYEYNTGFLTERIGAPKEEIKTDGSVPENIQFSSSVPNDVTGRWRLAIVDTEMPITEYMLDYYKNYFKSDDEIHCIINRQGNTTYKIAVVLGMLNVTTHKYIQGEENDAKVMFGGDVISDEYYDIETGQVADF